MSKVLILGGGVAGLSAGIYAAKAGHSVTVCEQHKIGGGNLTGWNRKGYHIDNCIHWLTGTNPHTDLYQIWKDVGALGDGIEIMQGEKLFAYESDGRKIALYHDLNRMANEMLTECPEDAKEIIYLRKTIEKVMYLQGTGGENHDKGVSLPILLSLIGPMIRYHRYSTASIAKRFKDPLMQNFFQGMMGPEFSMAAFLFVASTFCSGNGGIPKGSSVAMANRMIAKMESYGGVLKTGKKAVSIRMDGKRAKSVTFEDGETIEADVIISTIDPAQLFKRVLPLRMPSKLKKLYADRKFTRFSALHSAFGCEGEQMPFTGTTIFDIPKEKQALLGGKQLILREFSHESSFAPKGKSVLQTMVYCSETVMKKTMELAKDRKAYLAHKAAIAETIRELIEEKYGELKGKMELLDVWTPYSYHRYTGSEIGSFMSFTLPPMRIPMPLKQKLEEVENLILATQWLMPPGGLPMAAMQGKAAAELLGKA